MAPTGLKPEAKAAIPLADFFCSRGAASNAAIVADCAGLSPTVDHTSAASVDATTGKPDGSAAVSGDGSGNSDGGGRGNGSGAGSGASTLPTVLVYDPTSGQMQFAEVTGFDAASGAHDLRFLDDSALNGRIHLALACRWCPASRAALREHAPPGGARYPESNQAGLLASTCS